jgi:hypothetical protein
MQMGLIRGGNADKNTMVGSRSGELVTTGKENTGIGWNVFYRTGASNSITGTGNVGIGGASNPSGSTFNGVLGALSTGNHNVAIGTGAGSAISLGSENIVLGNQQVLALRKVTNVYSLVQMLISS